MSAAYDASLSPNGQRIVLRQPSGVPCWLDDRYLGVVENVGVTNQQAPEVFRADVTDDPLVVPRGVMGSTVAVTTQVEPFASLWG